MIKTKSDFGPDEFKVIREIILAHPRLQKKRKIGQMACVIAAFLMVLFALGTFLDRFILDCFIEYTLIFLAFAIFFIWFAKVGIYLEQDLVFKVIQNKTFDNVKNGTIEYIFDSDGQYLNLSMLQVNINGTHFNGGVCLKIIFIYKPLLKK